MPGPNSIPNGDYRVFRGHPDEIFVCRVHGEKDLDHCRENIEFSTWPHGRKTNCKVVPLRWYLEERRRLRTGKTL